jgi:transposase
MALQDAPRSGQPKKYNEKHEAELIAIACTKAPEERSRWTLELLTKAMQEKPGCKTISKETIRLILKKTNVSPG